MLYLLLQGRSEGFGWEPNITMELPLMFFVFVFGVFLTWLIQRMTGGFDKRGD